jgi:5-hydroxyisourate hydrolase-like protein (transthyretin family)
MHSRRRRDVSDAAKMTGPNARRLSITVTDIIDGRAAEGVALRLERQVFGNWELVSTAASNHSGSISFAIASNQGEYRITLNIEAYFVLSGIFSHPTKATTTFVISDIENHYLLDIYIGPNSHFWSICRVE